MNAHILFIKYPEAGRVKTRLGADIGNDKAAALYKKMAENAVGPDSLVFIEPYGRLEDFREWLGDRQFFAQEGGDLGERMFNALKKAFEMGYDRCVLTGSDIPGLTSEIIHDALENMQDASIGETFDGGYYLIGFRRETLTDSIFHRMPWSTDIVFPKTMHIFESMGYSVYRTRKLRDLDTADDLRFFPEIADEL